MHSKPDQRTHTHTALLAGGCFWCMEADLKKLPGVTDVISGYAGGTTKHPTYETYAAGGHREVVLVEYDPLIITLESLLIYAVKHMDPTDAEGSFADRGHSYTPAFYYENDEEKRIIEDLITEINEHGPYTEPIVIGIEPRPHFWPAEEYHQNYSEKGSRYASYRAASGRDAYIQKHWKNDTDTDLPWRTSSFRKPADTALKERLSPREYFVTQEAGTEPAFDNEYWNTTDEGIYVDVVSGEPLFASTHKFDSGTGWPSFVRPIEAQAVTERTDHTLGVPRTEIRSRIAHSHLGHKFHDGPEDQGGIRYCMNSAALRFVPKSRMEAEGYGAYLSLFEGGVQ